MALVIHDCSLIPRGMAASNSDGMAKLDRRRNADGDVLLDRREYGAADCGADA